MTKNLDQLRQVAERATPGPWARKGTAVLGPREPWDLGNGPARIIAAQMPWQTDRMEANAEHAATFDPPTVLALIDRVEAAEAAVHRVREVATGERTEFGWGGAMDTIIRALDGGEQE